jgi:uncharacterized membrane protein
MVWWRFLLLSTIVLATCSAIVIAADNSNGNINVEITKLDKGVSFTTLVLLSMAVVIIVLVVSLVFLLRRSSASTKPPKPKTPVDSSINMGSIDKPAFKKEGYYAAVFHKPKPGITISDEKSEPVKFINKKTQDNVERYLKEDERIVVNVLKMKHNSCTQATLRIVTDFSKARLSRILSELEERGVIFKEQQGRKNLITLKT